MNKQLIIMFPSFFLILILNTPLETMCVPVLLERSFMYSQYKSLQLYVLRRLVDVVELIEIAAELRLMGIVFSHCLIQRSTSF